MELALVPALPVVLERLFIPVISFLIGLFKCNNKEMTEPLELTLVMPSEIKSDHVFFEEMEWKIPYPRAKRMEKRTETIIFECIRRKGKMILL